MTCGATLLTAGLLVAGGCVPTERSDDAGETISTAGDTGDTGDTGEDGGSAPLGPSCAQVPVVHVVYFVEADETFREETRADLEAFAFHFQEYWFTQLGATFYLKDPVVAVILAEHEAAWYVETPDDVHEDERWYRLGNVMTEVYGVLDIDWFDPTHRVLSYPVARYDGRVGANFGGGWMDGDDLACLTGANGGVTWPYEGGVDAHCVGHPAHEFGHVLGLDHQGPQDKT